jgi:hypothetical protein
MHGLGVGSGMNGHRWNAKLSAGTLDPQRDLATVGDQNLMEQSGIAHAALIQ